MTSALFVFNFIPQHAAGFVWASWSIGIEMAFYLILPILLVGVTSVRRALCFFVISIFLSGLWRQAFLAPPPQLAEFGRFFLVAYLLYFAAGILGYFIWDHLRHRLDETRKARAGLLFLLGAAIILVIGSVKGMPLSWIEEISGLPPRKVLYAVALMLLTMGLTLAPVRALVNRASTALGKTSYSMYLWHPVIISLLRRVGAYESIYRRLIDPAAFGVCALLTFAVVVPLAFLSYRLIEIPGMRLANRFASTPRPVITPAAVAQ
jgi:peptidoglycan/LPS O-acetylase OafA/YrhL